MSKKKETTKKEITPNYQDFNLKMTSLISDLVQEQMKNKKLEEKNKELEEGGKIFSSEIQTKAIEITKLKQEKEKLNQNITELNEKIEKDKKEIEELRLIRKIHEEQNYESMLEEKNKLEKERKDIEQQYFEMKKNYENEKAKYIELDKIFYEYKKKYELGKSTEEDKISKLEKELKTCKDELNIKTKKLEEDDIKSKEIAEVMANLKKENEKYKSDMEDLKTESYNKIEEMKLKMEKSSQSVFSQEKVLGIIAENIHNLFSQEFSLSFNKIIEEILKNFLVYSQSIFSISESGENNIHNEENLYLYLLKDIYFYIYFYLYNSKKSKGETEISISSNDFTEEIINTLSNEIYKNNIIHSSCEDSQKIINDYMSNLKKLGVSDDHLEIIKENYLKKNEKFKIYLLNMIKSLVKKCADTIRNSTIEMNNKILYDFRNYNGEEYSFIKNNLIISNDKINNENTEAITNLLKYSSEKITRIQFNNSFDKNLSEYNIQKILLNLMTYSKDLLSLSFNNCENLNNSVISYIVFAVQNLDKLKIISFESCKLNDNNLKIITGGIKENKNIIAVMLRKNNITSQGALYISDYLNHNMNVKQLFLGYNNIKGQGLQALLNVLSTVNKNITNLDLSNNNFTLNDFNFLIEYLKINPILNSLDISGNKLQLKSSINLGAILCTIKNIKSINMSNMGIISEFIPNLFKSFNLDEIILDDNNLEEVGLIMLIKGLEANKNLKKISLKNTHLSFIGLTSLLKMLDKVKDFKELHLENNIIDDSCVNIMKTTLKNKQFKIFVSKNMINQELFKEDVLGKESNIIMI
jgi:hypothetical protein